jgi:glucosamine--fructose-6-phosphate aminotransferase (isomerizing)
LAFAMLSAALRGQDEPWRELQQLPEQVARAIDLAAGVTAAAQRFKDASHMLVIGRGYNLATASEIALKITETAAVMADGYSSADFHHGPKAILELRAPMLVVAPGPRVFEDLDGVARLAKDKGAPLVAFSDRKELLASADVAAELPSVPEWLSPVVAVVPGQLLALGLSLARGLQPDSPPGLSKVTRTR